MWLSFHLVSKVSESFSPDLKTMDSGWSALNFRELMKICRTSSLN